MSQSNQLTTRSQFIRNSINRSPLWRGFLLIPLALAWCALSPAPNAFGVSPPPDGGYAGNNTAEGTDALLNLTIGADNTAIGFDALLNNTGDNNTAIGSQALLNNTSGAYNTATGLQALTSNTKGNFNTANGFHALFLNTTGANNTANGGEALFSNITGSDNTANGSGALFLNTTGSGNAATGVGALENNTTGASNTGIGEVALFYNTTGFLNAAIGFQALENNTTGKSNIALGASAGVNLTTGSNNIDVGNAGVAGESKTIRIGTTPTQKNTFIAGISGVTVAGGVGVIIDTNGHLGTVVSSERFKEAIKPMDKASETILALQPVTFRYKHELDPDGIPQFGLVAEQVAKVNPNLVARDDQGKPYTVRYEAVNAMLLNEFLKEHRKVEALEATIAAQQKGFELQQKQSQASVAQQHEEIEALTAALKEQAAQIQKVNARLAADKSGPRVVVNNR